jgi:anti-anti-sigma factor
VGQLGDLGLASGQVALPVAMEMTRVAHFFERLGDHAVYISRRVICPGRAQDRPAQARYGRLSAVPKDSPALYVAVATDCDQSMVTVTFRGHLDMRVRSALAGHLAEHLTEHLAQLEGTRPGQLVFDMTEVGSLDKATAAVIFTAARSALPAGVKPVIRSPQRRVRSLLEITGLDRQCQLDPAKRRSPRRVHIPLPRRPQHSQHTAVTPGGSG